MLRRRNGRKNKHRMAAKCKRREQADPINRTTLRRVLEVVRQSGPDLTPTAESLKFAKPLRDEQVLRREALDHVAT